MRSLYRYTVCKLMQSYCRSCEGVMRRIRQRKPAPKPVMREDVNRVKRKAPLPLRLMWLGKPQKGYVANWTQQCVGTTTHVLFPERKLL